MNIYDLTKEQIEEMSQEEVFFWGEQFAKQEKSDAIRKLMLDQLEIREAGNKVIV